ncbi:MAG: hypothetical protein KBD56_09520 [Candidatus Eisenbacteria bacterium]|nr:hypothetical protein [Candidatus Eisenbacteria bacterium]
MSQEPIREFTRHAVATLAYRGAKILRGAPADFGAVHAESELGGTRSAVRILSHINDLLEWTARLVAGAPDWRAAWHASTPQAWEQERERFFLSLQATDAALTSESTPTISYERMFQGPISDAFTHLGQLAMLRRLAGAPIRSEVMVLSEIVPGRVGEQQTPPVREFD